MKVNFILGPEGLNKEYVNITNLAKHYFEKVENLSEYDLRYCYLESLLNLNDPIEEMLAEDVIGFFEYNHAVGIIKHWISKLSTGGTIIISSPDLYAIAQSLVDGRLDFVTANKLFFGEQKQLWDKRQSVFNIEEVQSILQSNGCEITRKRLENHQMYIQAKKL